MNGPCQNEAGIDVTVRYDDVPSKDAAFPRRPAVLVETDPPATAALYLLNASLTSLQMVDGGLEKYAKHTPTCQKDSMRKGREEQPGSPES